MEISKKALVSAILILTSAGMASAQCEISGGGRAGVVQPNDLLFFVENPVGNEGAFRDPAYRKFTDTAWAGHENTVKPLGSCRVGYNLPSGAHDWVNSGESKAIPADTQAIWCACPN